MKLLGLRRTLDSLEEGALKDSFLHRRHPAAKCALAVFYIVLVLSCKTVSALAVFALYPCVIAALADVPLGAVLRRSLPVLPFAFFIGLSSLFFSREAVWTVTVLQTEIPVTRGFLQLCVILVKALFSVSAALLLQSSAPFSELAAFFTRAPLFRPLGLTLILTLRYSAVLLDEAQSMWTAYALRGAGVKAVRLKDAGVFIGQLLLRNFDREERIFAAMKARGWEGVYRSRFVKTFTLADGVFLLVAASVLVLLRFVDTAALGARFIEVILAYS